jgi:uncharacterized protein
LLDDMHYRGLLRIAGRASGVRTYAAAVPIAKAELAIDTPAANAPAQAPALVPHSNPAQTMDALVDVIVLLRGGAPQWDALRPAALARAKQRLASGVVAGTVWYWPQGETPGAKRYAPNNTVRLLAPFDPVVWDRRRFELLWGWPYRFEAYTPAPKRVRGYYALPMLWREQVIGWGNVAFAGGALTTDLGYVAGKPPRDAAFKLALADELERMRVFLLGAP